MPSPRILVAYDAAPSGADALELGLRLAAATGGQIELAHVYHTVPVPIGGEASHAGREALLSRNAEELLVEAARRAGVPDAPRHVVAATTTATGLRELGEREQLELIVFGSAYNAAPGRVHPGSAARRLLQNGPAALAFAPVGYAETERGANAVAVIEDDEAGAAKHTAGALAAASGGRVVEAGDADLIVVGSSPGVADGRVQLSSTAEPLIQRAAVPVVVVPRGRPVLGADLVTA